MIQRISKISQRLLLVAVATSLGACTTLGPDYKEPNVNWLEKWEPTYYGGATGSGQAAQKKDDLSFWWKIFNDPVLNQLIDTAKQENLSLQIAGLRVFESRALLGIAGSSLYPQVQQASGAISYVNNQYDGGVAPDADQSFGNFQAGFNAAWELDFWGRFKRGIESADASFFASIANQRDAQVLISAQVVDVYYAYRVTEARIKIAKQNAEIQKRSFDITTKLFESGEQSELDLQQAKTQYLATLSSIPDLELSLLQTRNAMSLLLGRPPGDIAELKRGKNRKLPSISSKKIKGIPTQLLIRRPDVRTAAWQIAAQSAQIGIAEADYYPAIALLGTVGWSANSVSGSSNTSSLVVGPSFQWNIFDYGRIKNNIRIQDARLQQAIAAYQAAVLVAANEADDAAIAINKTARQKVLMNKTVIASERALEIANRRYQEGYASFQRVLDAQRTMFSQADRRLLTEAKHISAVISLYKSLGGGWTDTPVKQLIPEKTRDTMQKRSKWGDLLTAAFSGSKSDSKSTDENSNDE